MRVLVTGAAGFIGFHLCSALLGSGADVLGIDNFSAYYDPRLKEARARILGNHARFRMERLSIEDREELTRLWHDFAPEVVVHLAAQAGVRHSIDAPADYIGANILGTFHILELARHAPPRHLLAASTSSVYGANDVMPFSEDQRTQTPMSLYAATKGAGELMGHSYSHLFGVPTTFFRFFTVYGPWGRPDMALFRFTRAILAGEPIDIYNDGTMSRDFTYIDDLTDAIVRLIDAVPGATRVEGDSLSPVAPFRVVNIGGGHPVNLLDYVGALEAALGQQATKRFLPMQPGDVPDTAASLDLLRRLTGPSRHTPLSEGIGRFVAWYRDFYAAPEA